MLAKIYPAKNAMQSGTAQTKKRLDFVLASAPRRRR